MTLEPPASPFSPSRPAGPVDASTHDEQLARWNVGGSGAADHVSNRSSYHPAPRIRVDTRILSGKARARGLTDASLLGRARSHGYWPYRLCFERGLQDDQRLSGKTTLRLGLDARGRVRQARLTKTSLADRSVAECVADEARGLRVPPPARSIDVELTVELWPGDAPVVLTRAPRGQLAPSRDGVDWQQLASSTEPLREAVLECFAPAVARDPKLWGRVAVRVDFDASGRVTTAREHETRFPDADAARCVVETFAQADYRDHVSAATAVVLAARLHPEPG